MRDLHNLIDVKRGLSPAAAGTDNTAYVSQIVDRAGFEAVEFIILLGATTDTDATFAVLFEDGDIANLSDHAAVDDAYLLGTEALAGFTAADDDNKVKKIGYTGIKRYCRVTITPTGNNSGNIFIAGVWLLGQWLDENCACANDQSARTADLFEDWKKWAETAGEFVGNLKSFTQALEDRGFSRFQDSRSRRAMVRGLALRAREF